MRRATKIAAAIGVVLLVAMGLWLLIAPGQLVKYPSDLDKTAVAQGQLSVFLDPGTGTAQSQPQQLPLQIRRHVRVVDSSGSQATVQETSTERAGRLPEQTLEQRYLIDRSSLENVKSERAYAYTPKNVSNRAPSTRSTCRSARGRGRTRSGRTRPARPTRSSRTARPSSATA